MADVQTKILDIKVNYDEAIKRIVDYKTKIDELSKQKKELQKLQKEDSDNAEKYAHDIEELNAKMSVYKDGVQKLSKVTQNQVRQEQANADSLVQLRAKLSNLTAEYDSLSAEMRNSDVGIKLKEQINDVTTILKTEEEATQRYYRNVGNYQNAIEGAFAKLNIKLAETEKEYAKVVREQGSSSESAKKLKQNMEDLQLQIQFTEEATNGMTNAVYSFIPGGQLLMKIMPLIGTGANGMKQAFVLAGQGAQILGKQLLALMANPIVAFLALVAGAIMVLVNGIKSSEENMSKWQVVMAPVQRALNALQSVIQTLCGWILSVVEFGGKMMQVMMKLAEAATSIFPSVSKAIHNVNAEIENSIDLARREAQLVKDNRAYLVEEAKQQLEIAKLKEAANDKTRTVEERMKANQESVKREQALMDERLRLAQEEYEIIKQKSEWADNDAETNDKLAQAEANLYKTQKEYYDKTRQLMTQQNTLMQEQLKVEEQIIAQRRKIFDIELSLQKEGYSKQRKQLEENFKRQKEDLQRQLETETDLTEEQRKLINETIVALDKQKNHELYELAKKHIQEVQDMELSAARVAEDALFALVKEGYTKQREEINISYDRQIEDLQTRLVREENLTQNTRQSINDTILALEKQRLKAIEELDRQHSLEAIEQRAETIANELEVVKKGTDEEFALKQEQLNLQREQELAALYDKENAEELRLSIIAKYNAKELELEDEKNAALTEKLMQRFQLEDAEREVAHNRILEIMEGYNLSEEQISLQEQVNELENLRAYHEQLLIEYQNLRQQQNETDEAFALRKTQMEQSMSDTSLKIVQGEASMKKSAYQSIKDGISAMGEHSKAFAKMSKVLALAEIAINTGKALAAGVAQAQSVPYPANLIAIATTVGTILGNVASAISTVKSAKFARGGKVTGAGTETSDSIPAMLSNGEFVMTAKATKMFEPTLAAMNALAATQPSVALPQQADTMNDFQLDRLAEVIGEKIAQMPSPVVSVQDINEGQHRVEVINNLDNI